MKVYIAGPISNNNDYRKQFSDVEWILKSYGHVVINPVKDLGFDYKDYIDMGLIELSKCDAICLLKGWKNSDGAKLEFLYAKTVGLKIIHERDFKQ
ncbi:MAG: DUF4406 domain-containing protein [Longibaculum sp.]